ncbi:MAG: hypothetical protein IPN60_12195 [Saprospiraceae bacterium]|nr:hypothetical protein [Candidatus Opimibacter skivensis]
MILQPIILKLAQLSGMDVGVHDRNRSLSGPLPCSAIKVSANRKNVCAYGQPTLPFVSFNKK